MMARQVWEETKEKVAVALHAQQSEGAWSDGATEPYQDWIL